MAWWTTVYGVQRGQVNVNGGIKNNGERRDESDNKQQQLPLNWQPISNKADFITLSNVIIICQLQRQPAKTTIRYKQRSWRQNRRRTGVLASLGVKQQSKLCGEITPYMAIAYGIDQRMAWHISNNNSASAINSAVITLIWAGRSDNNSTAWQWRNGGQQWRVGVTFSGW